MEVTLIAAVAENNIIGTPEGVPWHLPRDITHFRDYCQRKALLVGRRTFEEMEGWFQPDQLPLILTRRQDYSPHTNQAKVVPDVTSAISLADQFDFPELVVIGGASVYSASIDLATKLLITEVEASPIGNASFPQISPEQWQRSTSEAHPSDKENPLSLRFVTWTRRA